MSDNSSALVTPGEVNIVRADLINHLGEAADITGMILELTLYEDVFSNTMSGYIFMEDAIGLTNTLPIIGQEMFVIELQTPSFADKISKTFYIYKMHNRMSKKRSQSYILSFCSLELISSINSKVSKAFKGNMKDNIISIFREDKYLASKSDLYVEDTKHELSFIAAFWSPLQTINWLCERSVNKKDVSNYVFFETNKAFKYVSLNSLIDSATSKSYVYSDVDSKTAGTSADGKVDIEKQFSIVQSMDTAVTFDYMQNVSSGMFASTLYTFDTVTRKMVKTTFDYLDDFEKTKHLDKYPLFTKDLLRKKTASVHHVIKNNYIQGNSEEVNYSDFYLQRHSLIRQMSAFKMSIKVFGRTDIKVGDVIDFKMLDSKEILKDKIESPDSESSYYSGRYLITAIRHQIIAGVHSMNMEIVSDSVVKELK